MAEQYEMWSNTRLPMDVQVARIEFKQDIYAGMNRNTLGKLVIHENREGRLPPLSHGEKYYEFQVGEATVSTARDPHKRGSRRLVALVAPGRRVVAMYFSDQHYTRGSWVKLQYP